VRGTQIEHYQYWQNELPSIEQGLFGENITSTGLTEHNVCIGDIVKIGTTLLQVSQARQPCWKLNQRSSIEDMAQRVQTSLRTGWYYRVLEQGEISVGDTIELIDRLEPEWPLIRLLKLLFDNTLDYESLNKMAAIPTLCDSWKKLAQTRIATRKVENWHHRLTTPTKL